MNESPEGFAHEEATAAPESTPEGTAREPEGFDAVLASALKDFGRQVRPREFDSHAILRRTARRKSSQVIASSAAALAVVAGATAFATHVGGPIAAGKAAASTTASQVVEPGSTQDPLTVPGYFRTTPSGTTAAGFSAYGTSANLTAYGPSPADGSVTMMMQDTQAGSTSGGAVFSVSVDWNGSYSANVTGVARGRAYTPVGTFNGHPAYSMEPDSVAFWAGPAEGYALAHGWNVTQNYLAITDPAQLLRALQGYDPVSVAVPMPVRITGLAAAQGTSASLGQVTRNASYSWLMDLQLQIDGRAYDISAQPGAAPTPSPFGPQFGTGPASLVSATKVVDGLGITVATDAGGMGSAPTVSQVLAHVSSLGTDPSGWSADVIVK